jgi:hypothetical protein
MLSLVAVLLAVTPAPSGVSLLSPAPARPVSARLLLAQAVPELTPPPASPDAPVSPREQAPEAPPGLSEDLDTRIHDLTLQVTALNDEIRGIDVNWPIGWLVMAYFGYVLGPLLLVGIPLLVFSGLAEDVETHDTVVALGVGLTGVGVAGVGLLVAGLVTGSRTANVNRQRRDDLVRERIRLEDELRGLKREPGSVRAPRQVRRGDIGRGTVPLVAFSF